MEAPQHFGGYLRVMPYLGLVALGNIQIPAQEMMRISQFVFGLSDRPQLSSSLVGRAAGQARRLCWPLRSCRLLDTTGGLSATILGLLPCPGELLPQSHGSRKQLGMGMGPSLPSHVRVRSGL